MEVSTGPGVDSSLKGNLFGPFVPVVRSQGSTPSATNERSPGLHQGPEGLRKMPWCPSSANVLRVQSTHSLQGVDIPEHVGPLQPCPANVPLIRVLWPLFGRTCALFEGSCVVPGGIWPVGPESPGLPKSSLIRDQSSNHPRGS